MSMRLPLLCLAGLLTLFSAITAGAASAPCAAKEFHQFDFWLGEWRVETPTGRLAGLNSVERIVGGCAIQENWRGSKGMTGVSVNSWDDKRHRWHQSWFDSTGGHLELDGEFREGRMVMTGDTTSHDGVVTLQQLTWTPINADRVRQLWQQSTDGGRTWQVTFDGIYIRRK
jgi:hypothetical protein